MSVREIILFLNTFISLHNTESYVDSTLLVSVIIIGCCLQPNNGEFVLPKMRFNCGVLRIVSLKFLKTYKKIILISCTCDVL